MIGKSYVINLKRRRDRLERFQKFYLDHGPNLQLITYEAIDGSITNEFDKVPETIKKCVSDKNDYDNKSSITATTYSHMMIWKEIAEGEMNYGMIYEDDCYFRQVNELLPEISKNSLKKSWTKIIKEYSKELEKPKSLLYFGVGDILPIHTVPPSESILISQETNHIIKSSVGKYFGKPNFESPYVFSWLGCSSYVVSKITAKYLLAIANRKPLECAVDVWLKRLYEKQNIDIYLTIPLMVYTPNTLDSDTSK